MIHVRQQRLAGIGELLELDTEAGQTVTVVVQRSGRREIGLRHSGDDVSDVTAELTPAEAVAVAGILTGATVELSPDA